MHRTIVTFLLLMQPLPAAAQDGRDWLKYGESLVRANCAACHAVAYDDDSHHPEAPAFRTLLERFPIDALEETFVERISVGHPDMPDFIATPDQIAAIIDYIGSLTIDIE